MSARSLPLSLAFALAFARVASLFAAPAVTANPAVAESAASGGEYSFLTVSLLPRIAPGNGGPDVDTSLSVNVLAGERANLRGFEFSPGVNVESGNAVGAQVGGLVNVVWGDMTGFQASPGVNVVDGRMSGFQLGLVNVARETAGFQFGFVNVSRKVTGFSLGFVTIEEGGILEGMTRTEIGNDASVRAGIGIKVGTKSAYSAFFASVPLNAMSAPSVDAGWGVRSRFGAALVDTDVSWRAPQAVDRSRAIARRMTGSVVFRASARMRGFPIFVGIHSEVILAGVSPLGDGSISPSFRVVPGFSVGSALRGE